MEYTRCSQKNISQVLQVLEITEIYIFHIFEFFLPPKVNSTRSKGLTDNDGDIVKCRRYSSSLQ